jgi:biotin carboxyl carrier protein
MQEEVARHLRKRATSTLTATYQVQKPALGAAGRTVLARLVPLIASLDRCESGGDFREVAFDLDGALVDLVVAGVLCAPVDGRVDAVFVGVGDRVSVDDDFVEIAGQHIKVPRGIDAARVTAVHVEAGAVVAAGDVIADVVSVDLDAVR